MKVTSKDLNSLDGNLWNTLTYNVKYQLVLGYQLGATWMSYGFLLEYPELEEIKENIDFYYLGDREIKQLIKDVDTFYSNSSYLGCPLWQAVNYAFYKIKYIGG